MGDLNIKSNNQSGGITAQNVNSGSIGSFSVNQPAKKAGKLKSFFWWVFGILAAASAIVTVLAYFSTQPK